MWLNKLKRRIMNLFMKWFKDVFMNDTQNLIEVYNGQKIDDNGLCVEVNDEQIGAILKGLATANNYKIDYEVNKKLTITNPNAFMPLKIESTFEKSGNMLYYYGTTSTVPVGVKDYGTSFENSRMIYSTITNFYLYLKYKGTPYQFHLNIAYNNDYYNFDYNEKAYPQFLK